MAELADTSRLQIWASGGMADAQALGACPERGGGSTPLSPTSAGCGRDGEIRAPLLAGFHPHKFREAKFISPVENDYKICEANFMRE